MTVDDGTPPVVFSFVPAEAFAAVREPSAEALLGDRHGSNVLSRGGLVVVYGNGGAGKTTLVLDAVFHLCSGSEWLELPAERCRVVWVENEGPRGGFRDKLDEKFATWEGPPLEGRLDVLEEPWARVNLSNPDHRAELALRIVEQEIDVLVAGPVQRLGVEGGGTPAEIGAFVGYIEELRALVGRPLAVILIHHENKAGAISGAWEGVTDTTAHVTALGHGRTRVVWQKVRWGAELHGTTWHLNWRDGERFERDEQPAKPPADVLEADLLNAARTIPGGSWAKVRAEAGGNRADLANARDRLLAAGELVNTATREGYFNLWAADDPGRPDLQASFESCSEPGTAGTEPGTATPAEGADAVLFPCSSRKGNRGRTERPSGGVAASANGEQATDARADALGLELASSGAVSAAVLAGDLEPGTGLDELLAEHEAELADTGGLDLEALAEATGLTVAEVAERRAKTGG